MYDGGVHIKHRSGWLLFKLLTVRRRRPARTCRRSGIHPGTGALSGCRCCLSPYWELYQKTRTAALPSWSSSSYTGPWRGTGSTGTQTVPNKKTMSQMWHCTSNAGWEGCGKDVEGRTMLTICEQGSPFFFAALQVPKSCASPMSNTFCGLSTVRLICQWKDRTF